MINVKSILCCLFLLTVIRSQSQDIDNCWIYRISIQNSGGLYEKVLVVDSVQNFSFNGYGYEYIKSVFSGVLPSRFIKKAYKEISRSKNTLKDCIPSEHIISRNQISVLDSTNKSFYVLTSRVQDSSALAYFRIYSENKDSIEKKQKWALSATIQNFKDSLVNPFIIFQEPKLLNKKIIIVNYYIFRTFRNFGFITSLYKRKNNKWACIKQVGL